MTTDLQIVQCCVSEAEDELISASADCSAIVWQNQGCGTKVDILCQY